MPVVDGSRQGQHGANHNLPVFNDGFVGYFADANDERDASVWREGHTRALQPKHPDARHQGRAEGKRLDADEWQGKAEGTREETRDVCDVGNEEGRKEPQRVVHLLVVGIFPLSQTICGRLELIADFVDALLVGVGDFHIEQILPVLERDKTPEIDRFVREKIAQNESSVDGRHFPQRSPQGLGRK